MSSALDDPVLTAHEAAEALKVHPHTVYRHIRSGLLQAVKQGNRFYIRRSWLDAFLALPSNSEVA